MMYSLNATYFFFLFSLFVHDAQSALFPKSDTLTSVHADLQVLVKEKKIRAKMEYTYIAPENQTSIRFYLTSDVTISHLRGDNISTFAFNVQASPLPTVTVFLKKPLSEGEVIHFSLSYEGQPKKIFQTDGHEWIDLDSDYILFPVFTNFQLFHYTLKASLDDHDYKFIDIQQKRLHNTITISPKEADYGFTSLFACKKIQFASFTEHGNTLTIISGQADSIQQKWSTTALHILTYYNTTFGKTTPQHEVTILFKPLPLSVNPVQKTNGNIIALASDSNEETLTHELAHLWWSRGNHSTMEKWLTESFAVYSQLMYWRSLGHQQEFDQEIARLKIRSEKLPALLTGDRFGYDGNSLIYSKGPYLLSVLEQRLGKEKFIQLLSNLNERHTSTTEDFLSELEKIESRQLRDEFENLLNK